MAQFDTLIIFPLVWSSIFTLFFHYTTSVTTTIPKLFESKKFRIKHLLMFSFFIFSVLSVYCFYSMLDKAVNG